MEVGSLLDTYKDLYKVQTEKTTSELKKRMDSIPKNATEEELMEACKQFEAYFTEQMFKEMAKTIPKAEEDSASSETLKGFYRDSVIQEITAEAVENNGFGLAQTLFEQMKRNYGL